jgi:CRISPR/Cas system endoribonuclease Cas6 (RAMP superfamily)
MIQEINQKPPACNTIFFTSNCTEPTIETKKQKANIEGYNLFIRLLYQLSKRALLLKNIVNPTQKKKNAFPIEPPGANILYGPYKISMREFVMNIQAKKLTISIKIFLLTGIVS